MRDGCCDVVLAVNVQVLEFYSYGDISKSEQIAEQALELQDTFDNAMATIKGFNRREEIFGISATDHDTLTNIIRDFAPFFQLWTMVSEFDTARGQWLTGPFNHLNASEISSTMERWWRDCIALLKKFKVGRSVDRGSSRVRAVL